MVGLGPGGLEVKGYPFGNNPFRIRGSQNIQTSGDPNHQLIIGWLSKLHQSWKHSINLVGPCVKNHDREVTWYGAHLIPGTQMKGTFFRERQSPNFSTKIIENHQIASDKDWWVMIIWPDETDETELTTDPSPWVGRTTTTLGDPISFAKLVSQRVGAHALIARQAIKGFFLELKEKALMGWRFWIQKTSNLKIHRESSEVVFSYLSFQTFVKTCVWFGCGPLPVTVANKGL